MVQQKSDLRITRTYKMLCDAFTRLLEIQSFEDITVNQLCEEAMIRRATFYKHFADKQEYLSFYLLGFKEEFNRMKKDSTAHESTQDFYLRMSHYLFEFLDSHQKWFLTLCQVTHCHCSSTFSVNRFPRTYSRL